MNVEPNLVDSLLSQRKVARATHVGQQMLDELRVERVEKVIRNYEDGRVAVSWPRNEPLPPGVIDGRPEHLRGEVVVADPENAGGDPDGGGDPDSDDENAGGDPDGGDGGDPNAGGGNSAVQIVPADDVGWFNVLVDGIQVNTKKLRKHAAIDLQKEYAGG